APTGDRLADHIFGVPIHLGGVEVRHAEVEAAPQGRDRGGPVRLVEVPSSLADHRNLARHGTERAPLHALRSRGRIRRVLRSAGWCGRSPSAAACRDCPRALANSLITSRLKAGMSSGLRLVTR